jgi:hypothetical protein
LTRDQRRGLVQELIAECDVWNGSGECLDQFLGGGKGRFGLFVAPLDLIEFSEVYGDAPQEALCALLPGISGD